jgi:hypothetical protein
MAEIEIDPTEQPEDDLPEKLDFDISSYPADYTVKVLVEKWRDGQLVIPDFQRDYVWTMPQASKLIESFLLGLPVPQVFLYKERGTQKLLVVDGQQRLSTLARFYDGRFSGTRNFRLSGVHEKWQGKRYQDLDEDDRLRLDDAPLRSIVIQQLHPRDNSSIYLIFERLNTGGTQLNPMEIRKSVFHGPAYDLIEGINTNDAWRALLGSDERDKRLRDVELALRVTALAADWQAYSKPMKSFLTDYMERLGGMSGAERSAIGTRFETACEVAVEELGERPFHLRGRLNVAALDAFIGATMRADDYSAGQLGGCFTTLLENAAFRETVFFNTSDDKVLKDRFGAVEACLSSGD